MRLLIETLEQGGIIAIPTESSYGLGVDPRDQRGVAAVYRFKGRPADRPLPVVLGRLEHLRLLGADPEASELAELARAWPAALTVVVPIERPLPATALESSVAVRVPAHERLRCLLSELGGVLTATSANTSGEAPITSPEELLRRLDGWPSAVIDDGVLPGGPPSTIVRASRRGIIILREGALSLADLRELTSQPVFSAAAAEISADES